MIPGASTIFWKDEPLTGGMLTRLREADMACVELTDYHPNWSYLKASWLRSLRDDLAASGLTANSLHTHFVWFDPELILSHPEPARRERAIEVYLRAVDALAMIGCPILLTHDIAIPDAAEVGQAEHASRRSAFVDSLARIAEYAAPAGISIAIENTTRGYATDTAVLRAIAIETGHENVGICIDTGHANLYPPVDVHVCAAGDRLITLQIDDSSDHANQHTLPGRGTTDWPAFMRALAEIDYRGTFVYELMDPADVPHLAENYRWLASMMPGEFVTAPRASPGR